MSYKTPEQITRLRTKGKHRCKVCGGFLCTCQTSLSEFNGKI